MYESVKIKIPSFFSNILKNVSEKKTISFSKFEIRKKIEDGGIV